MLHKISSFFFMLILSITSLLGISMNTYESRQLFDDTGFEKGFTVMSQQTENGAGIRLGNFTYKEENTLPCWMIAQWNSGNCLWNERVESDKYTITDGKTKWIIYNPDTKSVSMRLNAREVYKGNPAPMENWPHLLLEQSPIYSYENSDESEKSFYNCSSDRMVVSLDIRIADFKDTTNKDGVNAAQFLTYFYLKGVNGDKFIWFGLNLFDDRGYMEESWSLDKGSGQMIFCLSTKDTFGSKKGSLFRNGKPYISDEWVHVEVDLKPYIEKAMRKANQDGTFGTKVTSEDFYIGGANIGYEIHGNYDCTIEIKNFTLTSYNRK